MKHLHSIVLSILFICSLNAQTVDNSSKIATLNQYITFSNECTHGMLIVQCLYEQFNQDINKYVDLESHELIPFSNDMLKEHIFDNIEYYPATGKTPFNWLIEAKKNGRFLQPNEKKQIESIAVRMKEIVDELNFLRFKLEELIKTNDLSKTENLDLVYEQLERGSSLFEDFWQKQIQLDAAVSEARKKINLKEHRLYTAMKDVHHSGHDVIVALRNKEEVGFKEKLDLFSKAINEFKRFNTQSRQKNPYNSIGVILKNAERTLKRAVQFYEYADVDPRYKLYGKFYYYYNSELLTATNQVGSGFIFQMNKSFEKYKIEDLKFFEFPNYFKVIYPEKLKDDEDLIVSSDDNIELIPDKLKERIVTASNRSIQVDNEIIELELFDHMIQDGDIISLNFNGDWILENHSIEKKPTKIKLQLNVTGKNYLLLHAENIGKRPPNTMAISYIYKGKKEQILLKSDLNSSELIELVLEP